MDTYHVVLYIHLLSLFIGVGTAGTLLLCLIRLRAAQTVAEALPWGIAAGQVEKFFAIAVLGLFGSGAYMTSDVWTWSTGWIDVSIVGLVVIAVQGPLVGGRAGHALKAALQENGPGELSLKARRLARSPGMWLAEFANIGIVLGVVWNMTEKPATGSAIAAVVIAYAVGVAIAWPFTRVPAAVEAAAKQPA